MNYKAIGNFIKKQRKHIGLTQNDLANKLGITFQAVSKWETGETLPDTSLLLKVANILETTTDKILHGGKVLAVKNQIIPWIDDHGIMYISLFDFLTNESIIK